MRNRSAYEARSEDAVALESAEGHLHRVPSARPIPIREVYERASVAALPWPGVRRAPTRGARRTRLSTGLRLLVPRFLVLFVAWHASRIETQPAATQLVSDKLPASRVASSQVRDTSHALLGLRLASLFPIRESCTRRDTGGSEVAWLVAGSSALPRRPRSCCQLLLVIGQYIDSSSDHRAIRSLALH